MERGLTISVEGKEFLIFEEIIKQAWGYWENIARDGNTDKKHKAEAEERAALCRQILKGNEN